MRKGEFRHSVKADERDGYNKSDEAKWVVDVEAPTPRRFFSKHAANDRPDDGSDGPGAKHEGKVLGSQPQWDDVAENDLRQGDDAAASNALDTSTCEQNGEVFGYGAEYRSDGE